MGVRVGVTKQCSLSMEIVVNWRESCNVFFSPGKWFVWRKILNHRQVRPDAFGHWETKTEAADVAAVIHIRSDMALIMYSMKSQLLTGAVQGIGTFTSIFTERSHLRVPFKVWGALNCG